MGTSSLLSLSPLSTSKKKKMFPFFPQMIEEAKALVTAIDVKLLRRQSESEITRLMHIGPAKRS